jgi:hypothetical protein
MNKPFCEQIDRELLVEEYVRGKLQGEIRAQFEQHLRECERHARQVQLEKSLRDGVIEFARSQVRSTIRKDLRPREDMRYAMLRYAAFLFVAVVVPLLLYYQFRIFQPDLQPADVLPGQKASADSVQERSAAAEEKSTEALIESAAARKVADRARKTETVTPAAELPTQKEEGIAANDVLQSMATIGKTDEKLASQAAPAVAPPAEEQPALTMKEQQDLAVGQIAAGSKRQNQKSAAEAPQSVPEVAEAEAESVQDFSTQGYLTKEQEVPISADLKKVDSSRSENVNLGYGVSAGGGKSSVDDKNLNSQITAQEAELLTCTAKPDSSAFILVKFQITGRGMVENLQVMDTNIRNINIKACIIEKIRKWKFTVPEQKMTVTRKIILK